MDAVASIAGLLSLCGISSMRMFAPTFLFGAICRFLPQYDWCPEGVLRLAESCPSFLTSDFGLVVFGVLGVLELAANWDDTVRDLISESNIDTCVKPVFATLMAYSILTPEQVQVVTAAVGDVTNAVPVTGAAPGLVTNAVASAASAVAAASSDVASVSNAVAEVVRVAAQGATDMSAADSGSWFSSLVPALFCGGVTFTLAGFRSRFVAAVREMDPDNALHLNSLLTAFEEGSWLAALPLLLVFPVVALVLLVLFALFGWMLSCPLKRLAAKRRAHWDAAGREGMLREVRIRAIVIFVAGVLVSAVPVVGYLATVIALNLFVFSVLVLYEKRSARILARLVLRFVKLTLLLVALVFSSIPFMGVLLLVPYLVSCLMRMRRIGNGTGGGPKEA